MRVQSISSFKGYISNKSSVQNLRIGQNTKVVQNPSFGDADGEIIGGALGTGIGGFGALLALCTGPLGVLAIATIAAASVGGAAIGAIIGDKVTGDDNKR